MTIEVIEIGDVTLVNIGGRVALGQNEVTMRDVLRRELENGRTKIVLDLGEVCFMDSSGLGELVTAYVTAGRFCATIKLANLTKKIAKLIDVTRLSYVFEIHDSTEEAIRSFEERKIA
jgi:anti-sigma B factor antagonist